MPSPGIETLSDPPVTYSQQFLRDNFGKLNRLLRRIGGDSGITILTGVGLPSVTTGSPGNFYLDTSSHLLYGPKSSGGWQV